MSKTAKPERTKTERKAGKNGEGKQRGR